MKDRTQDGKACADDGEGTFDEDPVGGWCYVIYHGIELGGLDGENLLTGEVRIILGEQISCINEADKASNACCDCSDNALAIMGNQTQLLKSYSAPKKNMLETPILCFVDICRFHTNGNGVARMMPSINTSEIDRLQKFAF